MEDHSKEMASMKGTCGAMTSFVIHILNTNNKPQVVHCLHTPLLQPQEYNLY